MSRGYMELCLGAGAVLLALLDPSLVPFCGYIGGKRREAATILREGHGCRPGDGAREVVIAEAGPLGWVWGELLDLERAGAVSEHLRSWRGRDIIGLWEEQARLPPHQEQCERAAQVLLLQARTANNSPLRWDGRMWRMDATGRAAQFRPHRPRDMGVRQGRPRASGGCRGVVRIETLAERVLAIARALSRQPVRFVHGDYADAISPGDLSGWDIYWDPPYQGMTNYAVSLSRERVLRDAQDLRDRGATVTISEAVPLPLRRWRHLEITRAGGKPEWLTCSRWPAATQQQLPLAGCAA